MRVATIFTGVTTAAAGFAQAANAQPAVIIAPQNTVSMRSGTCPKVPEWFHMYFVKKGANWSSWCYGDKGISHSVNKSAVGFCGGNNFGYLYVREFLPYGGYTYSKLNFGPGTNGFWFTHDPHTGSAPAYVGTITISAWSGTDQCRL
jgi:hypothetical protein